MTNMKRIAVMVTLAAVVSTVWGGRVVPQKMGKVPLEYSLDQSLPVSVGRDGQRYRPHSQSVRISRIDVPGCVDYSIGL